MNLVFHLRILTGKKHPKIKLQYLGKLWIWTFGSLVHQINSFQEALKLKQIFQKNKAVTGKTSLFAIGQFCSHHSICLNIGFWQKVLNGNGVFSILMVSTKIKRYSGFLKKFFVFQKIWIKVNVSKTFKISTDCHIKTSRSPKRRAILKIPSTVL